jgi:hypothetical protein
VSSTANTPGDDGPGDFYDSSPLERDHLYQGEILVDVPILNMPKPQSCWSLLRTRSGRRVGEALQNGNIGGPVNVLDSNQSQALWYADGLGDHVMAVLDKRPVLILNQTCDIQSKDFLQVAPIFPHGKGGEALARLKEGMIFQAFWLQPHQPEIPHDSYADFEQIQAVHKTYLKQIQPGQHFRLNAARTRLLQSAITRYFGRPNSYDARTDSAPITGTYLCVWCFYMDAIVSKVEATEGSHLQPCPICGRHQLVLKGR